MSRLAHVHAVPAIVVPSLTSDVQCVPNTMTECSIVSCQPARQWHGGECGRTEEYEMKEGGEMEEGLKVRAGNEASRENTFIFWHMNNLFAIPLNLPTHPLSSMHNVFLHHRQRCL